MKKENILREGEFKMSLDYKCCGACSGGKGCNKYEMNSEISSANPRYQAKQNIVYGGMNNGYSA